MSPTHNSRRVLIVGGGIAGLSIAARLGQAGLPVTVLEASQLGSGVSTRNQGWLHSGAWFAPEQIGLARLCHEALQQTFRFCPEAVAADSAEMVYLTSRPETEANRWTNSWDEAEIPYRPLTRDELADRFDGLAISQIQRGFQLPDRSMQTNILLGKLAETAEASGVEIRVGTSVSRLLYRSQRVEGVEVRSGERIAAGVVILSGNAKGGALYPGFGAQPVGTEEKTVLMALKTHLVAVRPLVSTHPLCVVDADGFNHLPHAPTSVFGTARWQAAGHSDDESPDSAELAAIWQHAERLFPDLEREKKEVREWAGIAVHPMHVEQLEGTPTPQPAVIDHRQEPEAIDNLVSVFPGRATLWPHLAEIASDVVLAKLERSTQGVARPPWGTPTDSPDIVQTPTFP